MGTWNPRANEIFLAAIEIASIEDRQAYLDTACAEDVYLREQVESLLSSNEQAGSFLEQPAAAVATADEDAISEGPGTRIGPYKLLEQIGEGGFGVVYRAEQKRPMRRQVALKIIKPGMDTREVIARFEAERQALALMDHPRIARVLDAGATESGRPYFVMELIKGIPITEYCDQCNLPTRERLELFADVCRAVQHAHQKGIIHRDVKPTNVLIAMQDGRPAVKVIDFGVAKAVNQKLTERTLLTGFMQMVGTPMYMSPEQAEMGPLDVDTRTDIYSLGVLLYELLTGTTPFEKNRVTEATYDELRRLIREEEPPRPSTRLTTLDAQALSTVAQHRRTDPRLLSQQVRGDLDWIVMKALEKDRTRRYETASALAQDIERFLNDEAVDACPPSAAYRLSKYVRRNRFALAITVLVGAVLVLATAISTWQAVWATRAEALAQTRLKAETNARAAADKARRQVEQERVVAQRRLYDARLAQARAGRRSGQVGQRFESLKALEEAAQLVLELRFGESELQDVRNEAIACLALPDLKLVREWEMAGPDGDASTFDANLERYATINEEGQVVIRQSVDSSEIARITPPEDMIYNTAWAAGFSPGGELLATYHPYEWASVFHVWDWRDQSIVFRAPISEILREATCFSPDGRRLAIARSNGDVVVFDVTTGQELGRVETKTLPSDLDFSPDGNKLAVSSYQGRRVQILDWEAGKLLRKLDEPSGAGDVAWHPGGRLVAVAGSDFHIRVWDVEHGSEYAVLRGHKAAPHGLQFGPSGEVLCSWSWDRSVRLWNVTSGRELVNVPGVLGQLSSDGRRMVCRNGWQYQLWEVARGDVYRTLPTRTASVHIPLTYLNSATVSPDGRWLAVSGKRPGAEGVGLYDLWRGEPAGHLAQRGTENVLFHPSGEALFTGGTSGVHRWPIRIDGQTRRFGPPTELATHQRGAIAMDPNARLLVFADYNRGVAEVLNLVHPEEAARRLRHDRCAFVAVSCDARWIATGTWIGRGVKIWDTASGKLVKTLLAEAGSCSVYFSPDGRWLVTSKSNDAIRFWDVDTWKESAQTSPLEALTGSSVAWPRDGKLLAYSRSGYQVDLCDADTGEPLATLESPDEDQVGHLVFTPDGGRLVVFSERPTHVRVWELRRLRRQLAELGLDWDAPPYGPRDVNRKPTAPLRIEVEFGDISTDGNR